MPISALWWAVSRVACVRCSSCRTTPATATAPPSSQRPSPGKAKLPTHIEVAAQCCGLPKDSVILLEQIRTLDKRRLRERMGKVDGTVMQRVDAAIAVSFGLSNSRLV
jgi:mRNA interferase MazF